MHAAAEASSYDRARILLANIAGYQLDERTIQRVTLEVGLELTARRDGDPRKIEALAKVPLDPPDFVVVEFDGGRLRLRQMFCGPGVHLSGGAWREYKGGLLVRGWRKVFDSDPQPEPPACFLDPAHVANISETAAYSGTSPTATQVANARDADRANDGAVMSEEPGASQETGTKRSPEVDWRPKRLVRTVLASVADANTFGRQMQREAKRRRFYEANARAFLGDGLPANWNIQRKRFPTFTPILDFIHALAYLHAAARAAHAGDAAAWDRYVAWMRACWRGEVGRVIEELTALCERLGIPPKGTPDNDPRKIVATTRRYLHNNRERMRYPEYRKEGLPVTTAWMESLVKEINHRVKGSEKFWNDPEGAEAILQVRAAALSEDDRLSNHLHTRPGSPFVRRPKTPNVPVGVSKS